jgi:hypothetical protein
MMDKRLVVLIPALLVVLLFGNPQRAYSSQLPAPSAPLSSAFTYQGLLKGANGAPIHSTCNIRFGLWNAANGGAQIGGNSTVNGVSVNYGYFTALVNSASEFGAGAFDNLNARWLEIAVQCTGDGGFTVLSPRQPVSRSLATHDHWGQTWSWTGGASYTGLTLDGGGVGVNATGYSNGVIGYSTSTDGAGVLGSASSTGGYYGVYGVNDGYSGAGVGGTAGPNAYYGVYGASLSTSGYGVYGYGVASTGTNYGVWGVSYSPSGTGVHGLAGATTGGTYGVFGRSDSTAGYGIYGYAPAASGDTYGVFGRSDSTAGYGVYGYAPIGSGNTFGVGGESVSPNGTGVVGYAISLSGQGLGVGGFTNSTSGTGVYGEAKSTTGITYGMEGLTVSPTGRGVVGYATASTASNFGVYGKSNSGQTGTGVYGEGDFGVYGVGHGISAIGVYGEGTHYGVYGTNTSTASGNYAGYFAGPVYVSGLLEKPGGGFKIDHPLDPANQYLFHSFVESPDMLNVYNGTAALDANGEAVVQMPDWFEALNMDFHYQLTCIGGFAPVYIAQGIQNNTFRIAGGQLGMQVSWQVTGVRHDPWAEANRQEVEQPKPLGEQGMYLHPELYGLTPEMAVNNFTLPDLQASEPRVPASIMLVPTPDLLPPEPTIPYQPN